MVNGQAAGRDLKAVRWLCGCSWDNREVAPVCCLDAEMLRIQVGLSYPSRDSQLGVVLSSFSS